MPRLVVRTSAEDLARWHALAAETGDGISLSNLVRALLDSHKVATSDDLRRVDDALRELAQTRFQLAQIGNNLNQLVRLVHERKIHTLQGQDDVVARTQDLVRAATEDLAKISALLTSSKTDGQSPW